MIKSKPFEKLKLPFRVVYGKIGKLEVQVPWKNNFSSPTIVNIESVHIVISLLEEKDWEFLDFISYEAKLKNLTNFANKKIEEIKSALEKKASTYTDRVINKIVDNLHLNFKNLHLRIEEANISPYFSFGMTMQSLNIVNTDEKWKEAFIDRNENSKSDIYKLLKLNNLGFYFKINEDYILSKKETKNEVEEEMKKNYPLDASIFNGGNYLILPITLEAKLIQKKFGELKEDEARNYLWINLKGLDINFSKQQYDVFSRLMNHISNYQKFQLTFYESRRFQKFKPKEKLSKESSMKWFKWAIKMTIMKQKYNQGNKEIFEIPQILKAKMEVEFKDLLYLYLKQEPEKKETEMPPKELEKFEHIVTINEQSELYMWSVPIIETIYKERKKVKKKEEKSSMFSRMFGGAAPKEDELKVTKEEEEKILEILDNTVKEVKEEMYKKSDDVQLKVDFKLNSGFFKFFTLQKSNEMKWSEGFKFKYKDLIFSVKKADLWSEFESKLNDFIIEMFSEVNNNLTVVPITFKDNIQMKEIINSENSFKRLSKEDFTQSNYNEINFIKQEKQKEELIQNSKISTGNDEIDKKNENLLESKILKEDDFVWKLKVRSNGPESSIASHIEGRIKSLNLFYHQVLLERILSFFYSTAMNEDVKEQAFEKLNNIKESTQNSLKEALHKKNIVMLNIEPRIVVIPVNKYDIINSKVLTVELGNILMHNSPAEKYYTEKYNLVATNINGAYFYNFDDFKKDIGRHNIFSDISLVLSFSALKSENITTKVGYQLNSNGLNKNQSDEVVSLSHYLPKIKLSVMISKITINITDYLFALLEYIIDIFKPVKEQDMWASINQNTEEIKKLSTFSGKLMKKGFYESAQAFYAVLSGGYIYFFENLESVEYSGYYYIKDSIIESSGKNSDGFYEIKMKNRYGSIELLILKEDKFKLWWNKLNERITEMKASFDERSKEVIQYNSMIMENLIKNADLKEFFFGLEFKVKEIEATCFEIVNCKEDEKEIIVNNLNKEEEEEEEEYYSGEEDVELENENVNINNEKRKKSVQTKKKNSVILINSFEVQVQNKLESFQKKFEASNLKKKPFLVNCHGKKAIKLFTISLDSFNMRLNMREMDLEMDFDLCSLNFFDEITEIKELRKLVSSEGEDLSLINKDISKQTSSQSQLNINSKTQNISEKKNFFSLKISVFSDTSPFYNGTQIDLDIKIGKLYGNWNPVRLRKFLGILAHNDALRMKVIREIDCPTEKLVETNFVEKGVFEESQKLTCVATKYIYVKLKCTVDDVTIIWIQPKKEYIFTEIIGEKLSLDFSMTVDHLDFSGTMSRAVFNDLSNYPYTISSQSEFNYANKKNFLILDNDLKDNFCLYFNYSSCSEWCPNCKGQYTSSSKVILNNPILTYYHEHFLRVFNFLIGEFLGSMAPSEEVSKFRRESYRIKERGVDDKQLELMSIDCQIKNPKALLKPRPTFSEYIEATFGNISIVSIYQMLDGRVLSDKTQKRWAVTYQLLMDKLSISAHDGFKILEPIKAEFNMHFSYFTPEDLRKSDLEVDKSFQMDFILEEVVMNLRQSDLNFILKCSDLNILYSDMLYEDYYYQPLIEKFKDIKYLNINNKEEEKRKIAKMCNEMYEFLFIILASKITLFLFLEKEKPFVEIVVMEKEMNFYKRLNDYKECFITISKIELYNYEDNKEKELILSDFKKKENQIFKKRRITYINSTSQVNKRPSSKDEIIVGKESNKFSNLENDIIIEEREEEFLSEKLIKKPQAIEKRGLQIEIKITIEPSYEKHYIGNINNIKLIFKANVLNLLRYFFVEAFPYYDHYNIDKPNFYDPNEDNYPGYKCYLDIKNPLIAFLTSNSHSSSQKAVCISTDIVIGYKKEKIKNAKDELKFNIEEIKKMKDGVNDEEQKEFLNKAITDDKSAIYNFSISFYELSPFICSREILFTELEIPRRKIIDSFILNYDSSYYLKRIDDENHYIVFDSGFKMKKITVKLSYKDFVLLLKAYQYNSFLLNKDYEEKLNSLIYYTNLKKEIDEKNAKIESGEIEKSEIDFLIGSGDTNLLYAKNVTSNLNKIKNQKDDLKKKSSVDDNDDLIRLESPTTNNLELDINQKTKLNKKSKSTISDKGIGEFHFQGDEVSIVLIDDESETYYPFLCFDLNNLKMNQKFISYFQNTMNLSFIGKGLIYNYFAGNWEPIIEKTEFELQVGSDTSDPKATYTQVLVCIPYIANIMHQPNNDLSNYNTQSVIDNNLFNNVDFQNNSKFKGFNTSHNKHILNINISDLTIVFLYKSLDRWKTKFNNFMDEYSNPEDFKSNIKDNRDSNSFKNSILSKQNTDRNTISNYNPSSTIREEENLVISNHTIINHSGCLIKLYKIFKKDKVKFHKQIIFINELNENYSYNLEYFDDSDEALQLEGGNKSLLKENYIYFKILGKKKEEIICSSILKIDNIQTKVHTLDKKSEIKSLMMNPKVEKYQYICSEVKLDSLKKKIYLYSPINIENNTNIIFNITVIRKGLSNYMFFLEPGKIVGIPFEYLDGIMEIEFNESNTLSLGLLDLLNNEGINQLLKFKNNNSFTLISEAWKKPYRVITISHPYQIRNCLPFDISLYFQHIKNPVSINKGQTEYINEVSSKGTLDFDVSFLNFKTKENIQLFNPNNKKKPKKEEENINNSTELISVPIHDSNGNETRLNVSIINSEEKLIVIHCSGFIVNETELSIKFYTLNKKDKHIEIAGQNNEIANVFPIYNEKKIVIKYEINQAVFTSQPFPINAIGISTMVECVRNDKKYEFVVGSKLSLVDESLDIYCEIVTVSPKFILYNQLKFHSIVTVANRSEILRSNEKKAFYFYGKDSESKIMIRPLDLEEKEDEDLPNTLKRLNSSKYSMLDSSVNQKSNRTTTSFKYEEENKEYKWKESREFSLSQENLITLAFRLEEKYAKKIVQIPFSSLENKENSNESNEVIKKNNRMYVNIEKKIFGNSTFIVLSEANIFTSNFVVENFSYTCSMKIWQTGCKPEYIDVRSKKIIEFESNKSILNVQFLIGKLNENPLCLHNSTKKIMIEESYVTIYEPEEYYDKEKKSMAFKDKLTNLIYPATWQYHLTTFQNQGISIVAKFKTDGVRRRIEFLDFNSNLLYNVNSKNSLYEFQLCIAKMGISIIGDNKNLEKNNNYYSRYEIAYIALDNLVYFNKRISSGANTFRNEIQIQVREIQINNEFTYVTQFPVILRAVDSRKDLDEKSRKKKEKEKKNEYEKDIYSPPFLNIAITLEKGEQERTTRVVLFNYLIQSAYLNLDTEVLENVINFFNNMIIELKTSIS